MTITENILYIDDNYADFRMVETLLQERLEVPFECDHASSLEGGIAAMSKKKYGVVLLDLGFPMTKGVETLIEFRKHSHYRGAIVVLTGLEDEMAGQEAIHLGAQDYLQKGEVTQSSVLAKVLSFAIERNRIQWLNRLYTQCLEKSGNGDATEDVMNFMLQEAELQMNGVRSACMIFEDSFPSIQSITTPNLPPSLMRKIRDELISQHHSDLGDCILNGDSKHVESLCEYEDVSEAIKTQARQLKVSSLWVESIRDSKAGRLGCFFFFTDRPRKSYPCEERIIAGLKSIAVNLARHAFLKNEKDTFSAQFLSLFKNASESILLFNSQCKILDANPVACSMLDYSKEEILRRDVSELYDGGNLVFNKNYLIQRLSTGKPYNISTNRVNKTGRVFPVEISISLVSAGKEQLYLEICRDMSESIRAENQRKSLTGLLKALRNINRAITKEKEETGLIQKVVTILSEIEEFYHAWIVLVESDGKTIRKFAESNVYRLEHPLKDILDKGEMPICMQNAREQKLFFCTEGPTEHCDACPVNRRGVDHGAYAIALQYEDTFYGYFAVALKPSDVRSMEEQELFFEIAEDISFSLHNIRTEEKRKEDDLKYRLLAENSNDFIWMTSPDGRLKYVNPAGCLLTGVPEHQLMGQAIEGLIPEAKREEWKQSFERIIQSGSDQEVFVGEIPVNVGSEGQVVCEYTAKALREQNEAIMGIQGSFRDISERKRFEEQLIKARVEAESANAAKDEFLAVMSHEMRTPLNPILGFSELMLEVNRDETEREYLEIIRESAYRELEMVSDILEYIKLDHHKVNANPETFDMFELCGSLLNSFRVQAAEKGLQIEFDHQFYTTSSLFWGPHVLVVRVLSNLIANALKYTETGRVVVRVKSCPESSLPDCIQFEVEDTGVGTDPLKREHLFEPFYQIDSSLTRQYDGAGLGLAICKKTVELMGGEIGVTSEMGKGSCFWFKIPLKRVERSELPNAAQKPPSNGIVNPENAGTLSVLVVEDRRNNVVFLEGYLKRFGICPVVAIDGIDALEQIEQSSFDLVIMDLAMPRMDGVEACRRIRNGTSQNRHTRIWALTADASEERRKECKAAGFDGYLVKPFRKEEMDGLIRSIATEAG